MKFSDVLLQFKRSALQERGMKPKSYKAIVAAMEKLCEWVGHENFRQMDTGVIREFLQDQSQKRCWSPKTFRNYRQNLSLFFAWAAQQQFISRNPLSEIQKPKLPKRLPRCIKKEQARQFLSYAQMADWQNPFQQKRNEAIVAMFLFSGVRLNELLHLQMMDIDMEGRWLTVRQGKGNKDRQIPIHPKLYMILQHYLHLKKKQPPSEWLFNGLGSSKRLYEKDIYRVFDHLTKKSGIKVTPHMLRHTFAKLALEGDLNLYKLKEIMGHADVSTTQMYLSVSQGKLQESFERVGLI